MYSNIFIYVSLIGNNKFKQSYKYLGGGGHNFSWPRIFN